MKNSQKRSVHSNHYTDTRAATRARLRPVIMTYRGKQKQFRSIKEASMYSGVCTVNIWRCCNDGHLFNKQFKFDYA